MGYDWEEDNDAGATITKANTGAVGHLTTAISYVSLALAVVAFYSFFAPFVGTPVIDWYSIVLPQIIAPTEGTAIVDATPLIAGLACSVVALKLR